MYSGIIYLDKDSDNRDFIRFSIVENPNNNCALPSGIFTTKFSNSTGIRNRSTVYGANNIAISEEAKQTLYKILTKPSNNSLYKQHGDIGVFAKPCDENVKKVGITWKPENAKDNPNGKFYLDQEISIDLSFGYDPTVLTMLCNELNDDLIRMDREHQNQKDRDFCK